MHLLVQMFSVPDPEHVAVAALQELLVQDTLEIWSAKTILRKLGEDDLLSRLLSWIKELSSYLK